MSLSREPPETRGSASGSRELDGARFYFSVTPSFDDQPDFPDLSENPAIEEFSQAWPLCDTSGCSETAIPRRHIPYQSS